MIAHLQNSILSKRFDSSASIALKAWPTCLQTKVREAFSPAFHNFVDIDLPGGWLLVEAERAEKGICKLTNHTCHRAQFNADSWREEIFRKQTEAAWE